MERVKCGLGAKWLAHAQVASVYGGMDAYLAEHQHAAAYARHHSEPLDIENQQRHRMARRGAEPGTIHHSSNVRNLIERLHAFLQAPQAAPKAAKNKLPNRSDFDA